MANTAFSLNGYVNADALNHAKTCRLVVISGQMVLVFSNDRGECYRWEVTEPQLRGLVKDGVAELLR